jgi:hypothetical protein
MRRRFSSSSAAMAGEMSNPPNSDSVVDVSCAKLGFVISRCTENVHQVFVGDVIPVLAEFLVGCTFGPAGSGFSLSVLQEFDDGAPCSDVAFHGLRAQNLMLFQQIANGIDDPHLRKHHLRATGGGSRKRCFLATSIVGREHASNWQWIF